ncbi:MAG: type II secretion system protein [Catonella sp.]|jgi:type IV pilus assembly protein PilA|nr:type II secretion system protein [Catonella sp.]MDY6357004.1 type II secretion system protein [Catonella sp.]
MKKRDNAGFSLIELIVVFALISVIIAVLAPQYTKYVTSAKVVADIKNGQQLATAIQTAIADPDYENDIYAKTQAGVQLMDGDEGNIPSVITVLPEVQYKGKSRNGVNVSDSLIWTASWDVDTGEVDVFCRGVEVYPDATLYSRLRE